MRPEVLQPQYDYLFLLSMIQRFDMDQSKDSFQEYEEKNLDL